jgi:hypothetical protein
MVSAIVNTLPHIRNLVNRPSVLKRLRPEAVPSCAGVMRLSLSESSADGSHLMPSDKPRKLEALLS